MKADAVWLALPLEGFQPRFSESSPDYEQRRIPCGSSLLRPCVLTNDERAAVIAINRANADLFAARLRQALGAVAA